MIRGLLRSETHNHLIRNPTSHYIGWLHDTEDSQLFDSFPSRCFNIPVVFSKLLSHAYFPFWVTRDGSVPLSLFPSRYSGNTLTTTDTCWHVLSNTTIWSPRVTCTVRRPAVQSGAPNITNPPIRSSESHHSSPHFVFHVLFWVHRVQPANLLSELWSRDERKSNGWEMTSRDRWRHVTDDVTWQMTSRDRWRHT